MTVEFLPFGQRCNLSCTYCYEDPMRAAGNYGPILNLEAAFEALKKQGAPFTLFGGEPLLVPIPVLRKIWQFGLDNFGQNSLQTNGALITPEHIDLFERYRVYVGISIDGPGPCNDARRSGQSLASTRKATARTEAAIESLTTAGRPPSIIATVHRLNASPQRLPMFMNWLWKLDKMGIYSMRLHLLENDGADDLILPEEQEIEAFKHLWDMVLDNLKFDIFNDMMNLLKGDGNDASCIWHGCDPYTTPAVQGVDGDGTSSNCGRVNKDGVAYIKAASQDNTRQHALFRVPFELGGCGGCRFFAFCQGGCPGEGASHDWRNRSEHCSLLTALFTEAEKRVTTRGQTALSLDQPRRAALEGRILSRIRGVKGTPGISTPHVDHPHGDRPHQDKTFLGIAPVGRPNGA